MTWYTMKIVPHVSSIITAHGNFAQHDLVFDIGLWIETPKGWWFAVDPVV